MKGKSITLMLLLALFLTLEITMKVRYQPVIMHYLDVLPDLVLDEKIFYDLDTIDWENKDELLSTKFNRR